MVTVVWETWLKPGSEAEGLQFTRQIWSDMQHFAGYSSHRLLIDQDAANHLLVVSQWTSRDAADRSKETYSDAETVRKITALVSRPRQRWVFSEDESD